MTEVSSSQVLDLTVEDDTMIDRAFDISEKLRNPFVIIRAAGREH